MTWKLICRANDGALDSQAPKVSTPMKRSGKGRIYLDLG